MTDDPLAKFKSDYGLAAGEMVMQHRHGEAWFEADIPRRLHRCSVQTRGGEYGIWEIERCACGAIRYVGFRSWLDRNSRRKER